MANEALHTRPDDVPEPGHTAAGSSLLADERLPSIWRRNLEYITMALVGGVVVGTPFLIGAFLIRSLAVPSYYPAVFFAGGSFIIVAPAALTVWDVWQRSRRVAHWNKERR